jgi:hypothetical protein
MVVEPSVAVSAVIGLLELSVSMIVQTAEPPGKATTSLLDCTDTVVREPTLPAGEVAVTNVVFVFVLPSENIAVIVTTYD